MNTVQETEVLVVGAGPVGLFAALVLAERGIRTRIIDSFQRTALHSYAATLHPATLRMLDEFGIAGDLIDIGQRLDRVAVSRHDGLTHEFDLAAVEGTFPHALVVPQCLLEGALEKRLARTGVSVEWQHQLMNLSGNDGDRLSAQICHLGDGPEDAALVRTDAAFAIVADGYNSFARRALGIELLPVGPPLEYGLLETTSHFEPRNCAQLVLGKSTSDVFYPLPEDRGRWSIQLMPDEKGDLSSLRSLLSERAPWFPAETEPAEWTTVVAFQPRLAQRFGRGRVWMAGDCARFTSPIGAQSMNVGIREAYDLARRMVEILRDRGTRELLPAYNEDRKCEWQMLLGIEDRLEEQGETAWSREWATRLVPLLPATGSDLNRLLEQIGYRLHGTGLPKPEDARADCSNGP